MSGKTDTRRGILRGLTTLPLIGGGVTLLGNPTRAAVPITPDLLDSYDCWLHYERSFLQFERYGAAGSERRKLSPNFAFVNLDTGRAWDWVPMANDGARFHHIEPCPSTRAAVVLSAVGCGWKGL